MAKAYTNKIGAKKRVSLPDEVMDALEAKIGDTLVFEVYENNEVKIRVLKVEG